MTRYRSSKLARERAAEAEWLASGQYAVQHEQRSPEQVAENVRIYRELFGSDDDAQPRRTPLVGRRAL